MPRPLLLAALSLLVGCPKTAPTPPAAISDLDAAYAASVADAAQADPDEVVDDLVTLAPDDPRVTWDEQGRVLLGTWTSWNGYDDLVGQSTELGREVWATAVPNLSGECASWGLQGEALVLRLEQHLGLPPGNGKDRMVSLWVDPADVFRPCPDPSVTTPSCGLEAPEGVPAEHAAWVADLAASSYGEGGYPWTRLGYTYDWGGDSEVGQTEFVIRAGASVGVASVVDNAAYCVAPDTP